MDRGEQNRARVVRRQARRRTGATDRGSRRAPAGHDEVPRPGHGEAGEQAHGGAGVGSAIPNVTVILREVGGFAWESAREAEGSRVSAPILSQSERLLLAVQQVLPSAGVFRLGRAPSLNDSTKFVSALTAACWAGIFTHH